MHLRTATAALILALAVPAGAHAASFRTYVNERFGSTADVPADWAPAEAPANGDGMNVLPGVVTSASFLGNVVHYEIKAGSGSSTFRVEGEPAMPFDTGAEVVMSFRPEDTLAVPRS